jgi:hypothetical protein
LHRDEEAARMTHLIRYCTGCSDERAFEQLHADPASCPDVPDGECPEWGCPVCGDALFIGLPVREHVTSGSTSRAALPDQLVVTGSRLKLNRSNSHETWCFGMNLRGVV